MFHVLARFPGREVTCDLQYGSREEDERTARRHLRDQRGRARAAREMVARTLGLVETLASESKRAARFYARFGIREGQFKHEAASCADDGGTKILHGAPLVPG